MYNRAMSFEKVEPSINQVLAVLSQLEAKFSAEGNVDSERDVLNNIRQRLIANKITPAEAITEGQALDAGRIER